MKVKNYQELIVWQRAMDLVEEVYTVSRSFPREEIYGLTRQLRRAAISIPSNVAEGQAYNPGLSSSLINCVRVITRT